MSVKLIELFNLINPIQVDSNVKEIIQIHKNLLQIDGLDYVADEFKNDKEVQKQIEFLDQNVKHVHNLMKSFKEQQEKLIQVEKNYKEGYNKNKEDIHKITDFKEFVVLIDTKYKDLDASKIKNEILDLTKQINELHW